MNALRQVLGGLLAVLLVGGAVVGSALIAFAEPGPPVALAPSSTATQSPQPATLAASASGTPAAATATLQPPATASRTSAPTATTTTTTAAPTETSRPPTDAATVPSPTVTPAPATATPPGVPTVCTPSPPASWTVYVIQRGDTLYALSLRFGVSLGSLQQVNCIGNPSAVRVGQRIYAPNVAPPTPQASATPAEESTVPPDVPTITSIPVPSTTPDCVPPEFFDPFLNRCRLPDG